MYRFFVNTTAEEIFHFVVSNLVHRANWGIVQAFAAGVDTGGVWPEPTEPAPGGLADGDFLVTRAPDALAAGCGDAIRIVLDVTAGEITLELGRLNAGADAAYDPDAGPLPAPGDFILGHVLLGPVAVEADNANPETFLFASGTGLILAALDPALNSIVSGQALGYMDTAVLRGATTTPSLGVGEDPFPACHFDLANTPAPPLTGTPFGDGFLFNQSGAPEDLDVVVQMLSKAGDELTDSAIPYGGTVPIQVLSRAIVMQTPPATPAFMRGVYPNVFLTSRTVAKSVLHIGFDDSEYVVIGDRVAVGPL